MVFVVFSITLLLMMWYWTLWWFHSIYRTASALQKLPYMTTRYLQLSFRFFSLQATLVTLYFTIENLIVIYYLLQKTGWNQGGTIENITDNINVITLLLLSFPLPSAQLYSHSLFIPSLPHHRLSFDLKL
jgi:hypothetical protein